MVGAAVLTGAVATVAIDQRRLLRALGCSPVELARRCVAEVAARFPLDDRGATYAERVRVESSIDTASDIRIGAASDAAESDAAESDAAESDAARITRPRRAA